MNVTSTTISLANPPQTQSLPEPRPPTRAGGGYADPATEAAHAMHQEVSGLASDLGALRNARWTLANLDNIRVMAVEQIGEEKADEIVRSEREAAELTLKLTGDYVARTQQRLAAQYRVTGDLVAPDASGEPTLGRFTIETSTAAPDPAAAIDKPTPAAPKLTVKLDSEAGLFVTGPNGTTRDPGAAAAIALLRAGIEHQDRKLLDKWV
jgi:hypothetical protein